MQFVGHSDPFVESILRLHICFDLFELGEINAYFIILNGSLILDSLIAKISKDVFIYLIYLFTKFAVNKIRTKLTT